MLRLSGLAAMSILLATAGPLPAQPSGFYVGAGVGTAQADVDAADISGSLETEGFPVVNVFADESDTGWRLFAGYRLHPNLAAELSWVDLGESAAHAVVAGANPGNIRLRIGLDGVNLGLKAEYPLTRDLSVFAKLGIFVWNADADALAVLASGSGASVSDDSGTDLSFGLGVGYLLSERLAIRGDWDRYALGGGADTDLDLWTLSLQYGF